MSCLGGLKTTTRTTERIAIATTAIVIPKGQFSFHQGTVQGFMMAPR